MFLTQETFKGSQQNAVPGETQRPGVPGWVHREETDSVELSKGPWRNPARCFLVLNPALSGKEYIIITGLRSMQRKNIYMQLY